MRAKFRSACLAAVWIVALLPRPRLAALEADPDASPAQGLSVAGSLTNFGLSESSPFFSGSPRAWLETSARLEGAWHYRNMTMEASLLALNTAGHDAFGTGISRSGPGRLTAADHFYVDAASLQFHRVAGLPLKITIGRQSIALGSQFLIGDGVYDGFAPGTLGVVYHNPRKGFDAVRAQWETGSLAFDSFLFRVHPSWDAAGRTDGFLGGLDISLKDTSARTLSAGWFYRGSPSAAGDRMAILNFRGKQPIFRKKLYLSGELVWETARVCHYCARSGQPMNAYAWHAEIRHETETGRARPFWEIGYVVYSKDFTPVAPGASDWGRWYLGNQIDWIVFGSNLRVFRAETGAWAGSSWRFRIQFHNTASLYPRNPAARGHLSDEFTYIAEHFYKHGSWLSVLLGDSIPGASLERSGLSNPFSGLNPGALPVGNHRSFDVVLGSGIRF